MKGKRTLHVLAVLALGVVLIISGCSLTPQMTYQGQLTDASGNPLNGQYRMRFRLYHDDNTGTPVYTETQTVQVTDGLFDAVVGPTSAGSGLSSSDITQPLWLEVEVADGTYTETLSPRQRLYGAPYAFTLMPGTVISESMDSVLYGSNGVKAVTTIGNAYVSDATFESLPALRLEAEKALELANMNDNQASIYSEIARDTSELNIYSNSDIELHLDNEVNAGYTASVYFKNEDDNNVCWIQEDGDLSCVGNITGNALMGAADVDGETRASYAVQSPENWYEDFGAARLSEGAARVAIDDGFAELVNLAGGEYHVFLTPLGESNGLYVASKTATGFEVREQGGGTSDIAFDYRLVAKRSGYEDVRLPLVEASEGAEEAK